MFSPRRCFALGASLLFAASTLPAQGITWGPALGINLANLAGDDAEDSKSSMGLVAGVQLDMSTEGKALFWRSGVFYSMQGAKFEDAGPPASTLKIKLNYINIPVLAGFKLTPSKPSGPYLVVGPQIGIGAGCSFEFESGGTAADESCEDSGADIKGFDVSVLAGAGFSMPMGASAVHIAATYSFGLQTIDAGDPAQDLKNRVIAITVSYMMPGKRNVSTGN